MDGSEIEGMLILNSVMKRTLQFTKTINKGIIMKNKFLKLGSILAIILSMVFITACSDADVSSRNNETAADNFELNRRVVFFNGITDKYLLEIQGKCSIEADVGEMGDAQLEVICQTGKDEFKKHFLGLSDNVSYFVEQLDANEANRYHYRIIFKPETIIPNIDLKTSNEEK